MKNFLAGIDLGSRFVKIVFFKERSIYKKLIFDTAQFYKNYIINKDGVLTLNFEKLNITPYQVCSTGYGRNNVNFKNSILINELKAHVFGIFYQLNLENFTLIDVGGQDVKIIKVKDGYIEDFLMNDKCAASTGRYIENMANLLDVNLDYLSLQKANPVELNATCAIFGESEIIGKIAEGVPVERLCSGINYSLAKRIVSLMSGISDITPVVVSGGVANNQGLLHYIKTLSGINKVIVPPDPQFNGALGCINYILYSF